MRLIVNVVSVGLVFSVFAFTKVDANIESNRGAKVQNFFSSIGYLFKR